MRRRIDIFWNLPRPEKLLLAEAVVVVLAARIMLWFSGRERVWEMLRRVPAPSPEVRDCKRIAWAVAAVAGRIPMASCLTQALAGRELLRRRGLTSEIRLGVALDGGFRAHAWLLRDGAVLLGGALNAEYTELGTLPCRPC